MKIAGVMDKLADKGKTTEKEQYEISAAEAGNMWNKLAARYDLLESIMILMNYVKDEDLRKEMQSLLKRIKQQVVKLEKVMAEHAVSLPPRPPSEIVITEDIESITDRYIFIRMYYSIKRFLPVHIVAFQQSTSPELREMFKNFLLEEMELFERFENLGLRKNWLQSQPEYKTEKTGAGEIPTIMEIAQLWSKITGRYETIEFTNYTANLARDPDLKAAIAIGRETLLKQISELEKIMQQFAAPLPAKPPEAESTLRPMDAISDRYIYRQILRGVQSFLPVHMVAFQHSTTPALRKKLKQLLTEEIAIYDNLFTYGQLKGWVYKPPSFKG